MARGVAVRSRRARWLARDGDFQNAKNEEGRGRTRFGAGVACFLIAAGFSGNAGNIGAARRVVKPGGWGAAAPCDFALRHVGHSPMSIGFSVEQWRN